MTHLNPHSVLLVEDDPALRLALRTHFLHHGWHATVASGLREARTALSLESFALIVSDIRMLDGDGFQVLAAAQAFAPEAAVLFLTGSATVPEAVQAMREGALDYLAKPISFDLLLSHAQRVLRERSASRAAAPSHQQHSWQLQAPRGPEAGTTRPVSPCSMSDLERNHLAQTLVQVGGNRTRAAQVLGISVRTLRNKVRQYDLPPRRYA